MGTPPPLQKNTPIVDKRGCATEYFLNLLIQLNAGYTGEIATAKLTPAGTEGSITFLNGAVTNVVLAT
jgi:hypothetical protein